VYSSRVIFSTISEDLPFRSFSLYNRSASDPPPLRYVSNLHHYRLESEGKVWSVYNAHTYSESDNASLRYGHWNFSKMAAGRHLGFEPTENGAVRSAVPDNPTYRTKHEVDQMTRR